MYHVEFIIESNKIEGITRPPTDAEIKEFDRFLALDEVTIEDLVAFVKVYQPNARLRDEPGLDVRVGNHRPMEGGPDVRKALEIILLEDELTPYERHLAYENLHPFTDGNGRSGRALWAWEMLDMQGDDALDLGFLHRFYYQTLAAFEDIQA
jgi:hypothetical protein